jgi:nucleotide-binding universal stress UspA family protein
VQIKSVVVGIDFSDAALAALRWTLDIFAPGASITVVHAIVPVERPAFARMFLPSEEDIGAFAVSHARDKMAEVSASAGSHLTRTEIRIGKPYEVIVDVCREVRADMIVVGPHGTRPRPHKFLGTTAERIVRMAPVPVLVATHPGHGLPTRILVPVDEAPITSTVLSWTRQLAEEFDADVKLLHVWSNAIYSDVASMSFATTKDEPAARRAIVQEMQDTATHWLDKLGRDSIARDRVTAAVTYGNPGDATLEAADAMSADLIVLGRRGSGLIAPALLGSTVSTVLHGARCPVLVIAESDEQTD